MLSSTQSKAVGLLFEIGADEVAAKLKIKRETLQAWMQDPEFKEAMQDRLKENRQSAVRILSRAYLDASLEFSTMVHDQEDKNRHKVIVDVLKASGLLKELGTEDSDYVGSLLARITAQDEDGPEDE